MTEHNGWSHRSDSPVAEDVEVETVEAERVLTMVELEPAGPSPTSSPRSTAGRCHRSSAQELQWVQRIASWYASQVR